MTDIVEQAQKEYERFERVLGDTSLELIAEIKSLRQQLANANRRAEYWKAEHLAGNEQLAECQARETRKNEAIDCAVYYINNPSSSKPFALSVCDDALALPSDSTALDTMLKAAELKGRREALFDMAVAVKEMGVFNYSVESIADEIHNRAKELE